MWRADPLPPLYLMVETVFKKKKKKKKMMLQEQEFTLSHSYGIRDEGRKEGQENVNSS